MAPCLHNLLLPMNNGGRFMLRLPQTQLRSGHDMVLPTEKIFVCCCGVDVGRSGTARSLLFLVFNISLSLFLLSLLLFFLCATVWCYTREQLIRTRARTQPLVFPLRRSPEYIFWGGVIHEIIHNKVIVVVGH